MTFNPISDDVHLPPTAYKNQLSFMHHNKLLIDIFSSCRHTQEHSCLAFFPPCNGNAMTDGGRDSQQGLSLQCGGKLPEQISLHID